MERAKIELTYQEAVLAGAALKVSARSIQRLADDEHHSGRITQAQIYNERSAAYDAIADKLFLPFVGAEQIQSLNETADGDDKTHNPLQ